MEEIVAISGFLSRCFITSKTGRFLAISDVDVQQCHISRAFQTGDETPPKLV